MLYTALSFCIPEKLVGGKKKEKRTISSGRNVSGLAHLEVSGPKKCLRKYSVLSLHDQICHFVLKLEILLGSV